MSPDRKEVINGKKVEEYYWAGEYVTYIDNRLVYGSIDGAVEKLKRGDEVKSVPL